MAAIILQFVRVTDAPNRIRELRMQAKLSQQKLADRVGVSKVTISGLEVGRMQFTLDYMRRIAAALDVTVTDLLPREDNPVALTLQERQLIEGMRAASAEQREQLHKVAEVLMPFRGGAASTKKTA